MNHTTYSESEVHSLKAQEAKDYCIELMRKLAVRESGPISPGEVQLQELQYELQLKEAEAEDNRRKETHIERVKELELEIARENAETAKADKEADEQRQRYAEMIEQVATSQERLSVQLERATREHNVKLQMMQAEHDARKTELTSELEELSNQRESLIAEIGKLADLQNMADDIDRLRVELDEKRSAAEKERIQLDDEIEAALFDKNKELKRIRRDQELALAELESSHKKSLLEANIKVVDALLQQLGYARIAPAELESLQAKAAQNEALREEEFHAIREAAVEELKKQYNVSHAEPIDVTALYYREKALQEENEAYEKQVKKLDAEIARMRTHIESESSRLAQAIEAARTNIQNNIEPGVQR